MEATLRLLALGTMGLIALSLAACGDKRKASFDTGSAKATVSTEAPANQVPANQLDSQATIAATAASTPVDGSGPVNAVTPAANTTAPAQ
jgi:hypothetical protein